MAKATTPTDANPLTPEMQMIKNTAFASLYPWQHTAWAHVASRLGGLPHALLLGGKAGIGKRQFAGSLISRLLCEQKGDLGEQVGGCGSCASCTILLTGNHPRLLTIGKEVDAKAKVSKQLKIDQIRAINTFVQQTSDGVRIVYIDPAEALNIAAANALLKNLEEPAPNVLFMLLSDQPLALLPTIRSRVQQLDTGVPSLQQGLDYVSATTAMSSASATIVLNLSNYAPLQALRIAQLPHFSARQAWLDDWVKLLSKKMPAHTFAQQWGNKLTIEQIFALMQWMLRDIMAVQTAQTPLQIDLNLQSIAPLVKMGMLIALEQYIYQLTSSISQNIQPQLILADLSHKMAGIGW